MTALDHLRRLGAHARWADARLLHALRAAGAETDAALREFAHLIGAGETWLARVAGRPSRCAIWPDLSVDDAAARAAANAAAYDRLLASLADAALGQPVSYANSQGQRFATPLGDILLQIALHGQYHRGKINLLLRQAGREPAPVDYITYVRAVAVDVPGLTTGRAP